MLLQNSFLVRQEKKNIITVKADWLFCKECIIKDKTPVSGIKDILEGEQKGMCATHKIKANNGFFSYHKFEWKDIHPGKETACLKRCFRQIYKAKLINICSQNDTA